MPWTTVLAQTTRWGHRHLIVLLNQQFLLHWHMFWKCLVRNAFKIMSGHFDSWFWSAGFSCVCLWGGITRRHVVNCLLMNSSAVRTSDRRKPSCRLWRYGKYVDMLIGTLTNTRLIICSPFHSLSLSHFVCLPLLSSQSLFFSPSCSFTVVPYCPLPPSLSFSHTHLSPISVTSHTLGMGF